MYDNDNVTYNVGINWKDIIIKIIMLALFILFLIWLFPKANLDVFYDTVYTNNIKTMKEAARNYYTVDKLPANVGDKTSMTLKEMVDNHMLVRFTDKDGQTCDESNSKVEVTKLSENEYSLKVQLNCGEQKDYILETIGCTNVCSNGTCTTVITNGNNTIANNTNTNNNTNNISDNTNNSGATEKDDTVYTGDPKNPGYSVTVTLYQHRQAVTTTKTVYTCPSGYTKNGSICTKTYTATYVSGQTVYTCPNGGSLNGSTCTVTTAPTVTYGDPTYTCPTGYNYNSTTGKCEQKISATATKVYEYTCPEGYTKNGTKCTKQTTVTIDATVSTSTSTSYKYKWSEKSELEGWEFTGKTKTQTKNYSAGQK